MAEAGPSLATRRAHAATHRRPSKHSSEASTVHSKAKAHAKQGGVWFSVPAATLPHRRNRDNVIRSGSGGDAKKRSSTCVKTGAAADDTTTDRTPRCARPTCATLAQRTVPYVPSLAAQAKRECFAEAARPPPSPPSKSLSGDSCARAEPRSRPRSWSSSSSSRTNAFERTRTYTPHAASGGDALQRSRTHDRLSSSRSNAAASNPFSRQASARTTTSHDLSDSAGLMWKTKPAAKTAKKPVAEPLEMRPTPLTTGVGVRSGSGKQPPQGSSRRGASRSPAPQAKTPQVPPLAAEKVAASADTAPGPTTIPPSPPRVPGLHGPELYNATSQTSQDDVFSLSVLSSAFSALKFGDLGPSTSAPTTARTDRGLHDVQQERTVCARYEFVTAHTVKGSEQPLHHPAAAADVSSLPLSLPPPPRRGPPSFAAADSSRYATGDADALCASLLRTSLVRSDSGLSTPGCSGNPGTVFSEALRRVVREELAGLYPDAPHSLPPPAPPSSLPPAPATTPAAERLQPPPRPQQAASPSPPPPPTVVAPAVVHPPAAVSESPLVLTGGEPLGHRIPDSTFGAASPHQVSSPLAASLSSSSAATEEAFATTVAVAHAHNPSLAGFTLLRSPPDTPGHATTGNMPPSFELAPAEEKEDDGPGGTPSTSPFSWLRPVTNSPSDVGRKNSFGLSPPLGMSPQRRGSSARMMSMSRRGSNVSGEGSPRSMGSSRGSGRSPGSRRGSIYDCESPVRSLSANIMRVSSDMDWLEKVRGQELSLDKVNDEEIECREGFTLDSVEYFSVNVDDTVMESRPYQAFVSRLNSLYHASNGKVTSLVFKRYDDNHNSSLGQNEYDLLMSHIYWDVRDVDKFTTSVPLLRFNVSMSESRSKALKLLLLSPPLNSLALLANLRNPSLAGLNGRRGRVTKLFPSGHVQVKAPGGRTVYVLPFHLDSDLEEVSSMPPSPVPLSPRRLE